MLVNRPIFGLCYACGRVLRMGNDNAVVTKSLVIFRVKIIATKKPAPNSFRES